MNTNVSKIERRAFLRNSGALLGALYLPLLGGCDGDDDQSQNATGAAASTAAAAPEPTVTPVQAQLNLALAMHYASAQFYSNAASGTDLQADATDGVGTRGEVLGGRKVAFVDPALARYAEELAADKVSGIARLRAQLDTAAAAQPVIDLRPAVFSDLALAAGLPADFDPFADDLSFLLAAHVLEYGTAAFFRSMIVGDVANAALATEMGNMIYHGGLIRTLLQERADLDPVAAEQFAAMSAVLARLDGSSAGAQEPVTIDQPSSDLVEDRAMPLPLTRTADQVLRVLYLDPTGAASGVLPRGVNGVA